MTDSHRLRLMNRLPLGIAFLGLVLVFLSVSSFALRQNQTVNTAQNLSPNIRTATDRIIDGLQYRLNVVPLDYNAHVKLGAAYLQKARETGDISYYARAEDAALRAIEINPSGLLALNLLGSGALGLHEFQDAKMWAERAIRLSPGDADAYGVLGDAQVELGEYDDATANYQTMVDLKPSLSSYSRVSHIRRLIGDTDGAIEAMKLAVSVGGTSAENTAWAWVQLGNLLFDAGQIDEASTYYANAIEVFNGYHIALVGLAKARAAQGEYGQAISLLESAVSAVPEPKTLATLGDLYAVQGEDAKAQHQHDTIEVIAALSDANGQPYNRELALFYADHDINLDKALELADAEIQVRKDIYGYDALAWALYKNGRYAEAAEAVSEALKLGTQDANLYYHAGMIFLGNGELQTAREYLEQALVLNPNFSVLQADYAESTLDEIKNKERLQ